jgi:hypothetical protein
MALSGQARYSWIAFTELQSDYSFGTDVRAQTGIYGSDAPLSF